MQRRSLARWITHGDSPYTAHELRERIKKTIAFAESVKQEQYAGASERRIGFSWAPAKIMSGIDYLLQMTLPGTFFHVTTAYSILRHNGVALGKMDYLGSINLVDA